MAKKETIEYSDDGITFYKKSEYCKKHGIDVYKFNNLQTKQGFYKRVNGVEFKKVHIAKSKKCVITFDDCTEKTTVIKMDRRIFDYENGAGDYMISYTDINGNAVIMYMTATEFNTMFGFIVVFQEFSNIEMTKKKVISRFGKGVEFV